MENSVTIDQENEPNLLPKKERYQRANGTWGVRTIHVGETKTQQQFKDDCDVNVILKRLIRDPNPQHLLNAKQGLYLDLTQMPDYQQALHTVIDAQNAFLTIPSETRQRFNNDPSRLIQFLQDPKNHREAVELGLMVPTQLPKDPNAGVIDAVNKLAASIAPKKSKSSEDA